MPHRLPVWICSFLFATSLLAWSAPLGSTQELDLFGSVPSDQPEMTVSADFKLQEGKLQEGARTGRLTVQVELAPHWHIYSMTQPPGGPKKTSIKVSPNPQVVSVGDFAPERDPLVDDPDPVFNTRVEYYEDFVSWSAPFEIAEGVSPEQLAIEIVLDGQRCIQDQCIPIRETTSARFSGYVAAPVADAKFQPEKGHLLWHGKVTPAAMVPGGTIRVELTAEPQGEYHVYPFSPTASEKLGNSPTLIVFSKLGGWTVSEPELVGAIETATLNGEVVSFHHQPVTWAFTLRSSADARTGGTESIRGSIGYQTCTNQGCDQPASVDFDFEIPVAATAAADSLPVRFANGGDYDQVAKSLELYSASRKGGGAWKDYPTALVLFFAFLAGLILNVMPCVLPVIGIKIMSFVNQAGAKPGQLILLNVVFSLGIITVFLILATLAVFFGFGWGDLYKNMTFTIVMVSVLFIFALSFVGVWEIPLPGFVGHSSGAVQKQEGMSAAFLKGVFSTLLATPCSGPLLVPAVVWAAAQPVWITYLVFFCMGLGMAAPYLLISMFPPLVNALPRPGEWMVTFKVLMGFLLLGAVVFFFGSVSKQLQTSTLTLLLFLGFACYLVRHVTIMEWRDKLWTWGKALAVAGLGVFVAFYVLLPQHELHWEPYSKAALQKYLAAGRPVFVDATADWCFTCKTNEYTSFNRKKTFDFFNQHQIVALKADNTVESAEINEFLDQFGNTAHGLPYYAIYHPDRAEPLHFGSQTFLGPEDFLKRICEVFDAPIPPAPDGDSSQASGSAPPGIDQPPAAGSRL